MKSKMKMPKVKKVEEFPKLMVAKDKSLIALFKSESAGAVVWSKNTLVPLGSMYWDLEISCFEDFNGTITLSN